MTLMKTCDFDDFRHAALSYVIDGNSLIKQRNLAPTQLRSARHADPVARLLAHRVGPSSRRPDHSRANAATGSIAPVCRPIFAPKVAVKASTTWGSNCVPEQSSMISWARWSVMAWR